MGFVSDYVEVHSYGWGGVRLTVDQKCFDASILAAAMAVKPHIVSVQIGSNDVDHAGRTKLQSG